MNKTGIYNVLNNYLWIKISCFILLIFISFLNANINIENSRFSFRLFNSPISRLIRDSREEEILAHNIREMLPSQVVEGVKNLFQGERTLLVGQLVSGTSLETKSEQEKFDYLGKAFYYLLEEGKLDFVNSVLEKFIQDAQLWIFQRTRFAIAKFAESIGPRSQEALFSLRTLHGSDFLSLLRAENPELQERTLLYLAETIDKEFSFIIPEDKREIINILLTEFINSPEPMINQKAMVALSKVLSDYYVFNKKYIVGSINRHLGEILQTSEQWVLDLRELDLISSNLKNYYIKEARNVLTEGQRKILLLHDLLILRGDRSLSEKEFSLLTDIFLKIPPNMVENISLVIFNDTINGPRGNALSGVVSVYSKPFLSPPDVPSPKDSLKALFEGIGLIAYDFLPPELKKSFDTLHEDSGRDSSNYANGQIKDSAGLDFASIFSSYLEDTLGLLLQGKTSSNLNEKIKILVEVLNFQKPSQEEVFVPVYLLDVYGDLASGIAKVDSQIGLPVFFETMETLKPYLVSEEKIEKDYQATINRYASIAAFNRYHGFPDPIRLFETVFDLGRALGKSDEAIYLDIIIEWGSLGFYNLSWIEIFPDTERNGIFIQFFETRTGGPSMRLLGDLWENISESAKESLDRFANRLERESPGFIIKEERVEYNRIRTGIYMDLNKLGINGLYDLVIDVIVPELHRIFREYLEFWD